MPPLPIPNRTGRTTPWASDPEPLQTAVICHDALMMVIERRRCRCDHAASPSPFLHLLNDMLPSAVVCMGDREGVGRW